MKYLRIRLPGATKRLPLTRYGQFSAYSPYHAKAVRQGRPAMTQTKTSPRPPVVTQAAKASLPEIASPSGGQSPSQQSRDDKKAAKPYALRLRARRPALTSELRILRSGGIRTRDPVVMSDVVPSGIRHAPTRNSRGDKDLRDNPPFGEPAQALFPKPHSGPNVVPQAFPPACTLLHNLTAATRFSRNVPALPLSYGPVKWTRRDSNPRPGH